MKKASFAARAAKLAVKVLAVLLLFAFVAYINYTVDPGKIFSATDPENTELTAAGILLSGSNAENLGNYNERLIKRIIARDGPAYSTLIFGSSRGAMITADMVGAENAMNLSVTGATLDDYLGLMGVYLENHGGEFPQRIVMCIDPWLFNDTYEDERFAEALGDGYYYVTAQLLGRTDISPKLKEIGPIYQPNVTVGFFDLGFDTCKQILSIPYFQSAISSLFSPNIDSSGVRETEAVESTYGVLRADGSYSYPLEYSSADVSTIQDRANFQLPDNMIGYGDYATAQGEKYQLFCDYITYLRENGVRVDFLIPPIHSIIYEQVLINEADHPYLQVEPLVEALAEKCGCNVVGSFSPDAVGAGETDFYDGYHYTPQIGAQLAALLPEWEG